MFYDHFLGDPDDMEQQHEEVLNKNTAKQPLSTLRINLVPEALIK